MNARVRCYRLMRASNIAPDAARNWLPLLVGKRLFIAPCPDGWAIYRDAEQLCSSFNLPLLLTVLTQVESGE